jgi:hypothetical protein
MSGGIPYLLNNHYLRDSLPVRQAGSARPVSHRPAQTVAGGMHYSPACRRQGMTNKSYIIKVDPTQKGKGFKITG